jgi:hypothetical protein
MADISAQSTLDTKYGVNKTTTCVKIEEDGVTNK